MRHSFLILLFLSCLVPLFGQNETVLVQGMASYVSSQNVYVKYASTAGIEQGDTLFVKKDSLLLPYLLVKDKSSTSCVCTPLAPEKVKVGDVFFARIPKKEAPKKPATPKNDAPRQRTDTLAGAAPLVVLPETEEQPEANLKQRIKGRVSAASYSNFYGEQENHRMRYAFTMQGDHIGNSRFSTDNYITFRNTVGEWDEEVKGRLGNALKVYSLAVRYDLDQSSNVTFGRKINQRFSSVGAIDGLQFEKGLGKFMVGAIAGSRPNHANYGFDFSLLQAGAYVGYNTAKEAQQSQSTLGFIEQRNGGSTDRRFIYMQHSNSLLKNLSFFGSMEVDLYENINGEARSTANLTNLYLSLRQKVSKKTSLSLSYDNRKNIIYYESYKNFIDQLIDDETRQGLRFNVNYRPVKLVTLGVNASWRFQKSDMNLSRNLNSYVNFSRIPLIKATASISANLLQTKYLDSKLFGVRISKDIVPGKLSSDVYFRWVDYRYATSEFRIQQKVFGLDISFNLTRKLALYLYYEGTFDQTTDTFNRINTKLIQRF